MTSIQPVCSFRSPTGFISLIDESGVSPFKIRVAQTYPKLGDLSGNFAAIRTATEKAASEGADLIVFPELSLTGYHLRDMVPSVALAEDHPVFASLAELSREIAIVIGYVEESPDFQYYNASAFLDGGSVVKVHRKVYLPTYGMFEEQRYFSAGRRIEAFDTRFGRMGLLICEDALHPINPFILALDGAETIIILSASPGRGFGDADRPDNTVRWEEAIHTYSRIFTTTFIFANRVGYEDGVSFWGGSRVIAPDGTLLARAEYFEEGSIEAEPRREMLRRARIANPFIRDSRLDVTLSELQRIWDERSLHQ